AFTRDVGRADAGSRYPLLQAWRIAREFRNDIRVPAGIVHEIVCNGPTASEQLDRMQDGRTRLARATKVGGPRSGDLRRSAKIVHCCAGVGRAYIYRLPKPGPLHLGASLHGASLVAQLAVGKFPWCGVLITLTFAIQAECRVE